MQQYIALLRGINVGGHKKILMADLRKMFLTLGFQNISTYIQTGNVIFSSPSTSNNISLAKTIEEGIQHTFGFDVTVLVRSAEELQDIVLQNPFWKEDSSNIDRLHLTLIDKKAKNDGLTTKDYLPDKFEIVGQSIFLYCSQSYKDCKVGNNIIEKKLKLKATTRNWKTVLKILALTE